MELLTKNSQTVKYFFIAIDDILDSFEKRIENLKPTLNGERFLTGEMVCEILHISKRTLKDYRDSGKLPYIALPGKMLYKESDIKNVLEKNYYKAWEENYL